MHFTDVLLIIVSCLLITIIVLQQSKEDATQAFTGEKSELFANKKNAVLNFGLIELPLYYQ